MSTKTATLVKDLGCGNNPMLDSQALYKLSPPLGGHEFVVVSASCAPLSGPETYIFGADGNGKILNWSELDGSYRGGFDHEKALSGAGYSVASP